MPTSHTVIANKIANLNWLNFQFFSFSESFNYWKENVASFYYCYPSYSPSKFYFIIKFKEIHMIVLSI